MFTQRRPTHPPTDGRVDRPSDDGAARVPITAVARQRLERELASLRLERQRDIPRRLRVAREFGDVANNDELLAIREEEAVLATRIARLEDILTRAAIVGRGDGDDSAAVGSRVSVLDVDTGERLEYVIDGAHGARRPGLVSALSPVGRALLGRRRGERVSIELPSGRRRKLELRRIQAVGAGR
jgi:transcription elongation factor GreA